jgi:hypothetical protein
MPVTRSPCQETIEIALRPLVEAGAIDEADLEVVIAVIETTDRTPDQQAAVSRVHQAYITHVRARRND